ncbi:MAG TPA: hypothetical protein VHT03_09870 [Rhizomicrobium sp.]|nr:hypothetical protein [Rhizomicrobium sp.]
MTGMQNMVANLSAVDDGRPIFITWLVRYKNELANVVWGIGAAIFLFGFQTSLFISFWNTGALIINKMDGTVWVHPRGVECFENPAALDTRYEWLLRGQSGVRAVNKAILGFVPWKGANGRWIDVTLVGYSRIAERPQTVFFDRTDSSRLGTLVGDSAEAAGHRVYLGGTLHGYSSFLGLPYVLADYRTAESILGFPDERTNFFILDVTGDPEKVARKIQASFPELEIVSKSKMAFKSSLYWVERTGAGAAIMTAAVLALVVGFVFSFFSVQRFIDNIRYDLVTLLLLGADRGLLAWWIIPFCATIGIAASIGGAFAVFPFTFFVRFQIPWVHAIPSVLTASIAVGGATAIIASALAVRSISNMNEMEALRG